MLAEGPNHGFALARLLGANGEVGTVLTVRRPLVYRALDRLVVAGLAAERHREPGAAGPDRTVYRVTPLGRRRLARWLHQPVEHIRDLRVEFLAKLVLLKRSGQSPAALISAQRRALAPTLAALNQPGALQTEVELWRRHNARAAASFLDALARRAT